MTVAVREERSDDRTASIAVEREAFDTPEESAIVEAVRDLDGSFALVAEDAGVMAGHVQFSRAWIGDTAVLALGPVGVLPDHQGRGIGSMLIRAGLAEARRRGEPAVILIGERSFYTRFGFEPASLLGLRSPFPDVPEEAFLLVSLDPRTATFSGPVRWHPAFG